MNANNNYIFKYNKSDELYNYIELNKLDKITSYFKLEDNKLIRFDKNSDTKQLIKFKNKVRIKQKFMAGESFITIFDTNKDECVQYNMPEKEKCITLIKNNISISDFGKFVVERWKNMNNKTTIQKDNLENIDNNIIKLNKINENLRSLFSKNISIPRKKEV